MADAVSHSESFPLHSLKPASSCFYNAWAHLFIDYFQKFSVAETALILNCILTSLQSVPLTKRFSVFVIKVRVMEIKLADINNLRKALTTSQPHELSHVFLVMYGCPKNFW